METDNYDGNLQQSWIQLRCGTIKNNKHLTGQGTACRLGQSIFTKKITILAAFACVRHLSAAAFLSDATMKTWAFRAGRSLHTSEKMMDSVERVLAHSYYERKIAHNSKTLQ